MSLRAVVREFGRADQVVRIEHCDLPVLAPDHVRVRMIARSINPSDLITISGAYRSRTSLPLVPGFEGVGIVEDVGRDVTSVRMGARVLPIGTSGMWQDYKDSDPKWCFPVPDALSDFDAATAYVNPLTAWLMLHHRVQVKPGIRIAVNAASSSIGTMLIKMANEAGAQPFAIVRSANAASRLDGLSLARILDASSDTFNDEMADLSKNGGLDVVLDCVGGSEACRLLRVLRPRGRFIHYGLLSGTPIPSEFFSSRPDIVFELFSLRNWIHTATETQIRRVFSETNHLVAVGVANSFIRATYDLSDVSHALVAASDGVTPGKVLLTS